MASARVVQVDGGSPTGRDLLERAGRTFRGTGDGAAAFLAAEAAVAFVAVDDDEVAGWCWGYLLPRPDGTAMAYLHELEVAEVHRRGGVGADLLRAFAWAVGDRGASKMFLSTGEANTAARRLYESLGGRPAEQGPTVSYWFGLPLP
jgi:ribosomal protein S18 acetylase RimI-like enzyme